MRGERRKIGAATELLRKVSVQGKLFHRLIIYLCDRFNLLLRLMALHFTSLNSKLRPRNDAFSDDLHLEERRWFAVRTAAKHEKKAVRELSRAGIEAWTPVREKVYNYTSKKVTRQLPLLVGYAFVKINQPEEITVRRAHYVARFVTVGKRRKCVTPTEIELLQKISTDRQLDWTTVDEAFDFAEGTPVEIIHGTLAGVKGIYLKKKNKKTFVIALSGLGACLSTCEIDPTALVALEGSAAQPVLEKVHEGKRMLW